MIRSARPTWCVTVDAISRPRTGSRTRTKPRRAEQGASPGDGPDRRNASRRPSRQAAAKAPQPTRAMSQSEAHVSSTCCIVPPPVSPIAAKRPELASTHVARGRDRRKQCQREAAGDQPGAPRSGRDSPSASRVTRTTTATTATRARPGRKRVSGMLVARIVTARAARARQCIVTAAKRSLAGGRDRAIMGPGHPFKRSCQVSLHSPVVAVVLAGLTLTASAGSAQNPPEPRQGQARQGRDLDADAGGARRAHADDGPGAPRDVVYDLGSGDGRMVIAAAKRGAQAVGVEFNPELVALSESRARAQGVAGKARFVQGDIFETEFSEATVVTLYLLSTLNMRLRPTLLKMRPGTRVVSHAFNMEDWPPDEVSRAEDRTAYLWIVPAPVEGPGASSCRVARRSTWRSCSGSRSSRARSRSAGSRRACASPCCAATRSASASSTRTASGTSSRHRFPRQDLRHVPGRGQERHLHRLAALNPPRSAVSARVSVPRARRSASARGCTPGRAGGSAGRIRARGGRARNRPAAGSWPPRGSASRRRAPRP